MGLKLRVNTGVLRVNTGVLRVNTGVWFLGGLCKSGRATIFWAFATVFWVFAAVFWAFHRFLGVRHRFLGVRHRFLGVCVNASLEIIKMLICLPKTDFGN